MIVDPSAASFIEALRREGFQVVGRTTMWPTASG